MDLSRFIEIIGRREMYNVLEDAVKADGPICMNKIIWKEGSDSRARWLRMYDCRNCGFVKFNMVDTPLSDKPIALIEATELGKRVYDALEGLSELTEYVECREIV